MVKFNLKEKYSELSWEVNYIDNHINTLDYVNLVSLFVVKEDSNAIKNINYDWLYQRENNIDEKYNFDHLIPDLLLVKESIEEYCIKMDPIKLASLQNQINTLKIQLSNTQANSAKARIQNQLSYKLGQAMIENSKSILGFIRMPYVLSYIKDKHKLQQKIYEEIIKKDPSLKLPRLESYADYQEAKI